MTAEHPSRHSRPHDRPRRSSRRERAFVLGGLALALPVTAAALVLDADGEAVGFVWLSAVAWTALASLAAALRSGLADGDWSAFRGGDDVPDTRAESFDWDTRTGAFAYLRIREDRERLLDDDGLRDHDPGL